MICMEPLNVRQNMMQLALQSSNWEDIIESVATIRQATDDISNFIGKQLLFAGLRDFSAHRDSTQHIDAGKTEMVRKKCTIHKYYALLMDIHSFHRPS